MLDLGRGICGLLRKPAITFLLGMGLVSIMYSSISLKIVAPIIRMGDKYGYNFLPTLQVKNHEHKAEKLKRIPQNILKEVASHRHRVANEHEPLESESDYAKTLKIINRCGEKWKDYQSFQASFNVTFETGDLPVELYHRLSDEANRLNSSIEKPTERREDISNRPTINIATIVCIRQRELLMNLLKSLIVFSQDANLHLIVFTDKFKILDVGRDLLSMKWRVQQTLGYDFTFELHLRHLPNYKYLLPLQRACTGQRLFFSRLLPHIDSLVSVGVETIMLSNVTEMWDQFRTSMGKKEIVAMAPNNEDGAPSYYGPWTNIPFVGKKGVNGGVVLMNLTRMRAFKFEERVIASSTLYRERIKLADQDVMNIIFAAYPEHLHKLKCSYTFNWVHCGGENYVCKTKHADNICFCKSMKYEGVRAVIGEGGTFHSEYKEHAFLPQLHRAFSSFDFVKNSAIDMFKKLVNSFKKLPNTPCKPLTTKLLYGNALKYLKKLTKD